jgi:hypothetical protein
MPEKIEIIYDFDGYANQRIKNVELSRVNGYRTKIIKEGEGKMVYQLKNITEVDVKKIIECADFKGIDIEEIIKSINKLKEVSKMSNEKTDDEKVFSKEIQIVEKYQESHPGISYRDAVIASRASYSDAVKILLKGEKPTLEEKLIEEYMSKNPKATYKDAVIESLSLLKKEEKEE